MILGETRLTFLILQMGIIVPEHMKCFPHFLVDSKALPNFFWKSSKSILKVSSYLLEVGEIDLNSLQPFSFHPFKVFSASLYFWIWANAQKSHVTTDLYMMGTGDSSPRAQEFF